MPVRPLFHNLPFMELTDYLPMPIHTGVIAPMQSQVGFVLYVRNTIVLRCDRSWLSPSL